MAKGRILSKLTISELSGVDNPCQEHARVSIMKRAPRTKRPHTIAKATFQEALEGQLITSKVNEAFYSTFDGMWERNDAFRTALTDELADGGDGATASDAYVASVKALVESAVAAARDAGSAATDADLTKAFTDAATEWLESQQQETTMSIANKAQLSAAIEKYKTDGAKPDVIASIQKAAKDLNETALLPVELQAGDTAEVTKLAKTVERLTKSAALPVDVKSHYDALADDTARDAFLAKSVTDQRAEMIEKNAGDPVIYKCADGTEIRKSDGGAAAKLAKSLDDSKAEIAELRTTNGAASIEKRAQAYPNVAKGVAASILKSVDLMTDQAEKDATLASLTAMNKAQGGVFTRIGGDGDGGTQCIAKAVGNFDAKVAEIAKSEKMPRADAMAKARNDHPELFAAAYPDMADEEDAA